MTADVAVEPPMRASSLLCEHGMLGIDLDATWRHAAGHVGSGGGVDGALDRQMGTEATLLLESEYEQLRDRYGVEGGDGAHLPSTRPAHGDRAISSDPAVCAACVALRREAARTSLRGWKERTVYVRRVKAPPAPTKPANGRCVNGDVSQQEVGAGGAGVARGSRRSSRSGAGSSLSFVTSASMEVYHLKLQINQACSDAPSQMRLYYKGELLADKRTLEDAGLLPSEMLDLYIDASVEADDVAIAEALAASTGEARQVEGGFLGSALLGDA